jgi:hypothetical protein
MKIEIDGHGLWVVLVWQSIEAVIRALLPLLSAVTGFLAALPSLNWVIPLDGGRDYPEHSKSLMCRKGVWKFRSIARLAQIKRGPTYRML